MHTGCRIRPVHAFHGFLATLVLAAAPGDTRADGPATFSGCGVLSQYIECGIVFESDDGSNFFVENIAPFTVGDRVFVTGVTIGACSASDPIWCARIGCIVGNSIGGCVPFEACGTIVAPPFCGLALAADTGGFWLLDKVGAFGPGDRVHVVGAVPDTCLTVPECNVGACVSVASIDRCGESFFSGCGQVVDSFTCGLGFAADDGSGIYVLDDFGGAEVGAVLFVAGPIDAACRQGASFCACIHNDVVKPCTPSGDLDLDGDVDGGDLGIMLGAWGPCSPGIVGCLGDLDFDGEVDGGDLGLLLGAWSAG